MIIAAHVSMSGGGLVKACERAAEIGCNGMQIFTGSPRMWKSASADVFKFEGFDEAKKANGIEYVVIHATYLINLASDNPELVAKSRGALINDMKICAKGKMAGVVVHLGSHQGRGFEAVKLQVAEEIKKIIVQSPEGSVFLIENSAGQKGKIASDFGEIRYLLDQVGSERLGWCFDTCHGWAAGYAVGNKLQATSHKQSQDDLFGESKTTQKDLFGEIERLGLWETLKCVHVNDSRDGFGTGRDRHANLGQGEMAEAMEKEVAILVEKSLPLVLEVPGFDNKGPDSRNVEMLKHLAKGISI